MKLPVDAIEVCRRVQTRAAIDKDAVATYTAAYQDDPDSLPAITVFCEAGTKRYIVADGHHRLQAASDAGLNTLNVDLREGDEYDALAHAVAANIRHGLRLNKSDRKRLVGRLMTVPRMLADFPNDDARAAHLGVSTRTFSRWRADWATSPGGDAAERAAKDEARGMRQAKTRETTRDDEGRFVDNCPQTTERQTRKLAERNDAGDRELDEELHDYWTTDASDPLVAAERCLNLAVTRLRALVEDDATRPAVVGLIRLPLRELQLIEKRARLGAKDGGR